MNLIKLLIIILIQYQNQKQHIKIQNYINIIFDISKRTLKSIYN